MNDLEMAAKFREAAAYVRRYGWDENAAWEVDGGVRCAEGVLCSVTRADTNLIAGRLTTGSSRFSPREHEAISLIDKACDSLGVYDLTIWNDSNARTEADVIALFEGLAHDLELRHQVAAIAEKGDEPEPQPEEPEKEPAYA